MSAINQGKRMKIARGKVVSIDYTLTDESGEILDSSKGHAPLSYIQGHGNIIPGLENSLEGRSAGENFKVTVPPKDAYGEREEGKAMQINRDHFKGVTDLEVGMQFHAQGSDGTQVVTVIDLDGDMGREEIIRVRAPLSVETTTVGWDSTIHQRISTFSWEEKVAKRTLVAIETPRVDLPPRVP